MLLFKRFFSAGIIVFCFFIFSTVAKAEESKADLQKQITELKDQVKTLKKNLTQVYKHTIEDVGKIELQQQTSGELKQTIVQQQKQIDDLQRNLAFVYKQSIKDTGIIEKYKLGNAVYLRSSYYDLQRDDFLIGDGTINSEYNNSFINYFDLKFSAYPTQEIQFNATLTMYKNWGAWNSPQIVRSSDFNYSGKPSDAGGKIKRAYVDYRPEWMGSYLNMTFGRLPTSDGFLSKYRYNRPGQTSYPDLSFNAESDGVAFTFYFNNPLLKSINMIYARSEDDTDMYPFRVDAHGLEDIDFYAFQLNAKIPFLDDSKCVMQWLRVDNIRVTGDDVMRDSIDDYNHFLQCSGQPPFVTDLRFPQELGYVDKYTIQLNNDRLLGGPIDFFASVSWNWSHPNEDQVYVNGQPLDPDTLPVDMQAYTKYLYLLSADNQETRSGWAVFTGLRYNIDFEWLRNPKIGLEYVKGSKYWAGLNIAAMDPYQKLNTRGNAWEIYWIQPCVADMLQLRTGYQYIERDYTESLMAGLYGNPEKTNETDKLFYCSFEFMF